MANNDYFQVTGGKKLAGTIVPSGNKNEALPAIAAALLTEEEVVIENIPDILDTRHMIDIAADLGVKVKKISGNDYSFKAWKITKDRLDTALSSAIRSSLLFLAPMLLRKGTVPLPLSGGDKIGKRRIDSHLFAFEKLGVTINDAGSECVLTAKKLKGTDFLLDEASVMATENAVMLAVLTPGTTSIYNAACEPHVQNLCIMLNNMGAVISGIGTNRIVIKGVKKLHGTRHRILPDHIETGSFMGLAAVIGGGVTIKGAYTPHMEIIFPAFRKLGIEYKVTGNDIFIPGNQKPRIEEDFGGSIPSISDQPWPSFPADLTSIMVVAAVFSKGTIIIHEKMFEGRLFFVDSLIRMGAKVVLCDPHRVVVSGPGRLKPTELSSPDIRAGMALLIAALAAKGTTVIKNIKQIDRGYQDIDLKLKGLGAGITRIVKD
ncbi:MAG TPA: UDP-N-acetylglucosamine 1-carboxyvinyltransferase [Clostridiales bacterium]|nr:UDP-N-acetylglucosamine 1-carboxyvinyltransferase [Clostridiales bacterium]HQP70019.1 UDP-N-acetylglucosamine 1-carboxyvinyltransferase [Clostridiales bacterium]